MKKICQVLMAALLCALLFCACGEESNNDIKEPENTGNADENKDNTVAGEVTVTFDFGEGFEKETVKAEKGSRVKRPETPNRENYVFDGWFSGEEKISFPCTVTDDITFTASWTYEDPEFYTQPEDMSVYYGENEGPTVEARLKKGTLVSYQWYVNSKESTEGATKISGADERKLQMGNIAEAGTTVYCFCRITRMTVADKTTETIDSKIVKIAVQNPRMNILAIGSGNIKIDGRFDSLEYLSAMLGENGEGANIDSIVFSQNYNIWEKGLTGENQSKVKEAFETKKYSYVILQMGRDYVLVTESTRQKELDAYKNIVKMAQDTKQDCKFILMQGPWRQNTASSYYTRFTENNIKSPDDHKKAIRNYIEKYILPINDKALICDSVTAFEMAIEQNVDPFGDKTADFPNNNGGYLTACLNYALITGKSPVGLKTSECSEGTVSAADAAAMQKIAAQVTGVK